MGSALVGSDKPFVGTNATGGIALAGFVGLLSENDVLPTGPRIDTENAVVALAHRGVRASVVRLPPAVHGNGSYGFVSGLIEIARHTGISGYRGDGAGRWGATHAEDVARLYHLALESAPAGSRLHAVAEEGIPLRDIAETIAGRLGVPSAPIATEEAERHFGFLDAFVGLDNPVSNRITRDALGWAPARAGLLAELEQDPELTPDPRRR